MHDDLYNYKRTIHKSSNINNVYFEYVSSSKRLIIWYFINEVDSIRLDFSPTYLTLESVKNEVVTPLKKFT